jgi:adenylylsulfate kinase
VTEPKSQNITFHHGQVTRDGRAKALGQRGCTVWFTGLSGSGKSTVAVALEAELHKRGKHVYRLDGDNIRFGLNRNLGFSAEDRHENIRRIGEVAKLFADSGLICLCSFVSPYRGDRDLVRQLHAESEEGALAFFEVYVDVPLDVAESRDPKGLYEKARKGEIKGFTGIDDPFEAPASPELRLPTGELTVAQSVERLVGMLDAAGVLTG